MSTDNSRKQAAYATILVEKLAEDTKEEDIQSLFEQYGTVSALRMAPGAANRRGEGRCYLNMRHRSAKAAIDALDGKTFGGSILRVREAQIHSGALSKPQRDAEDEQTKAPTRLSYRVESVEKAEMPAGTEGDDWYRYVLLSGNSRLTGFHRGSRAEVEEYASHWVEEYNLRSSRGKYARPMAPAKRK